MTSPSGTGTNSKIPAVKLEVGAGSIITVLLAVGGAILATGVVVASRRVLSWVVACAVVAALIELVVEWLDRYMNRVVAIILVLLTIGAGGGLLAFGVMHDLDQEVHRLQVAAPQAAHDIETSKRFGKTAREVHLETRIRAAVDELRAPSSGLAGQAVSSVGTYVVCIILTILFLSWGPRLMRGALSQLEPERQRRLRHIAESGFMRARRYVSLALLQSFAVGLIGFAIAQWNHLPAPAPLALALAVLALIPNIGIIIGALPLVLLTAGLSAPTPAILTTAFFVLAQVASSVAIQPRIVRISRLYVGPTIVSVAFLAGFELYGIGGAIYAAALFVMGVAVSEAAASAEEEMPKLSDLTGLPGANEKHVN